MIYKNLRQFCNLSICIANGRQSSTVAWKDKLFVNYLQLPNLLRPTGKDIVKDVDLTDKTCLITGGTSGLGSEIVRCLMEKNCNVLMACRNTYAAHILSKNVWGDPSKLTTYRTNLASLATVKKTTDELKKDEKKIDIVILNAAVFGIPWTLTEDGFETHFQVNFLSQFYMLMNIQNLLAPDARVVFMSSDSHRNLKWRLEDTISPTEDLLSLPKKAYTSIKAYNTSKICQIFAMRYLGYRWVNSGKSVFCANPGTFIKTKLCANWKPYEFLYTLMIPFSKSIAQGAATPLYCATSPELQGQSALYIKNCKECEVSTLAHDSHLAFRIIDLSKNLLTERIGFDKNIVKEVEKAGFERKSEEMVENRVEEPVMTG